IEYRIDLGLWVTTASPLGYPVLPHARPPKITPQGWRFFRPLREIFPLRGKTDFFRAQWGTSDTRADQQAGFSFFRPPRAARSCAARLPSRRRACPSRAPWAPTRAPARQPGAGAEPEGRG